MHILKPFKADFFPSPRLLLAFFGMTGSGAQNSAPSEKFLGRGHVGVMRTDVQDQKLRQSLKTLVNKHLDADIHELNARASPTPF